MTQKEKDFCEALAKLMDDYGITMRVIVPVSDPYKYLGAQISFAEENKEEEQSEALFAWDTRCTPKKHDGKSDAYSIFTAEDIRNHIAELTAEKGIENV